MAISENTSSSTTLSTTAETTLATITSGGSFQLVLDLTNMVNGDDLTLRVKGKIRTGDTAILWFEKTFINAPGAEKVVITPWFPAPWSIAFTLQRTTGANAYIWAVYEYA